MLWFRTWAFVMCFALGGVGASAACRQADFTGAWDLYVTDNDSDESGVSWTVCALQIAANGTLQLGTVCFDARGRRFTINDGRLAVASACRVRGYITLRAGFRLGQVRIPQGYPGAGEGVAGRDWKGRECPLRLPGGEALIVARVVSRR